MAVTVELDLDLLALDQALEWVKQRSARKHGVVVLYDLTPCEIMC